MPALRVHSPHQPAGDQPKAIERLLEGVEQGLDHQVLLGITGSGKTFTAANLIERTQMPTLILAHNKTLAAQLFEEFRRLFPDNAVEYFVSYFDFYQPEAYVPSTDTFIEKDSAINERIDALRHRATRALLERRDVIVVASVSCIYGLGRPQDYLEQRMLLQPGDCITRRDLIRGLVERQYKRNDVDLQRGCFRARGDVLEIIPSHDGEQAIRVELWGDEIDGISSIDPLTGRTLGSLDRASIYPTSHHVTDKARLERALSTIRLELAERLEELRGENALLEAQRLEQRTRHDLEMMEVTGHCSGIENYSRHLEERQAGEPAATLLDYFKPPWLMLVDESHVSLPQVRGMHAGDQSRKRTLVQHGFRLPSALDNRPLQFEEFLDRLDHVVHISATPGDWEIAQSSGRVVEQIIRPTGLLDPQVELRPAGKQVDDLYHELKRVIRQGGRVLVTTLTRRLAQELTDYYRALGLRVEYLHADVDTLDRVELLRRLRVGDYDVLIGINLLREGLDLPEVMLVAIMDADKEGYLRSKRSLIQTIGRAARNTEGRVILYADKVTASMDYAMKETARRRQLQAEHNARHQIEPRTVIRPVESPLAELAHEERRKKLGDSYSAKRAKAAPEPVLPPAAAREDLLSELRQQMQAAADSLEFEEAARLRDRIRELEAELSGG